MKYRKIGTDPARSNLQVSVLGLGCMGTNRTYGTRNVAENHMMLSAIRSASELGVTLLDTADMYGPFSMERLVGQAIAGRRDDFIICTKFGSERNPDGSRKRINGRPEYVRRALDGSLSRLGVDYLDVYYQHRVDRTVPVQETWGELAQQVKAGKVRYLGISEASPATIRRAHSVHPVTFLQTEYSLWTRDVEQNGSLQVARDLGVGFVAYSPLGRGVLTGAISGRADLRPDDFRLTHPRFQSENLRQNVQLTSALRRIAADKGLTMPQVALAWLMHQGDYIFAIPNTLNADHLKENCRAVDITLQAEDLRQLSACFPVGAAFGDRYADMASVQI